MLKLHICVLAIILFICGPAAEALERIPGAVHLDTNISDGAISPGEMVAKVKEAGLKVAITSDKDNQRVEYGLFPLRRILRKVVENQSVMTYGPEKYLELLNGISHKNPDMTIIAGLEAVPFYYWQGNYFDNDLKLMDFHKHLLVIGLEKPEAIKGIPSVGYNNPLKFNSWCLLNTWPVFLLPLGLWLSFYKKTEHVKLQQLFIKRTKRPYLIIGIAILSPAILFTANNVPFCPPLYDQYHGDMGAMPYQNFIDYVENRGGMVFWAHPDVEAKHKMNGIEINTRAYHEELLRTHNYTGFAVLLEGMKHTGNPGGIWDSVLKQYLKGERKKPVWAIGELDFKEGAWMGDTQTVFLVDKNNKAEILAAMRNGRMYAVSGEQKPVLVAFQVWDNKNNNWAEMGGTATVRGKTRIKIGVSLPDGYNGTRKLKMIREGIVIKEFDMGKHLDMEWVDEYFKAGAMTYYRLDIDGRLISNPIFVKMNGK